MSECITDRVSSGHCLACVATCKYGAVQGASEETCTAVQSHSEEATDQV